MLQRTEGIVLKSNIFGEADLIVTHLTSDHGIIKTFAKSPRKTKSRFGSSLEPLTCSRISFWGKEDAALPRLTQSDIIHSFESIRTSLQCFLRASEIIELILRLTPERESCGKVYPLLISILRSIEKGCETGLQLVYYKLKILQISGYLPRLDGCGRCGGKGGSFFIAQGTVLCGRCSAGSGASFDVSPAVLNLYSNLLAWSISKVNRIRLSERQMKELTALVDDHVRYVTEAAPKTGEFRLPSTFKRASEKTFS
ncbi:MAG: DNA repair protein RecO [Nitrospirae bacterium]|nr:DNA repair protein RecO [Nitrospirota bacterium]